MLPLFAPILAQVVTISAADRTEVRVVVSDDTRYEAATSPVLGVGLGVKRFQLQLSYAPTITVVPLESTPRRTLVFHTLFLGATYNWKRTIVSASQSLSYGEQNFRVLATANGGATPVNNNGTPTQGGGSSNGSTNGGTTGGSSSNMPGGVPMMPNAPPNTLGYLSTDVRFGTYSANVGVTRALSPSTSASAIAGYGVSGGLDEASRALLPTVQGPNASVSYQDRLDFANRLSSTLSLQYSSSSLGNRTWVSNLNLGLNHRFNIMTSGQVSGGLSGARAARDDGYVAYSIYPTFAMGLGHVRPLYPGSLSLGVNAASAPAIDFQTLVVDPRISFDGNIGYRRDRFFSSAYVGSAYSISGQTQGAFSGITGGASVGYQLATAVSLDSGVRVAWQAYNRQTSLPLTYVGYVGLSIALSDRL